MSSLVWLGICMTSALGPLPLGSMVQSAYSKPGGDKIFWICSGGILVCAVTFIISLSYLTSG